MADRALLHRNSLEQFKEWLLADGWILESTHEFYKVLQARKTGRKYPLMVYQKHSGDHYSVMDRDYGVVRAFIRNRKKINSQ